MQGMATRSKRDKVGKEETEAGGKNKYMLPVRSTSSRRERRESNVETVDVPLMYALIVNVSKWRSCATACDSATVNQCAESEKARFRNFVHSRTHEKTVRPHSLTRKLVRLGIRLTWRKAWLADSQEQKIMYFSERYCRFDSCVKTSMSCSVAFTQSKVRYRWCNDDIAATRSKMPLCGALLSMKDTRKCCKHVIAGSW